ncbi:Sulfotransferase domain-containing protein [Lentibacillus halodurans]|uniref:Sulfotransferase domain-containing protein n=1 Tax=Lentibacillus halodurans TaxID=237679 RepID=A0A1I0XZC0_9BACI|nr:sulfotransferase domain-containing protein [Lentibacillus halodurans]SFB05997.1 Sulfotransferase domain-containing protein [Lentibacillus halodurans]
MSTDRTYTCQEDDICLVAYPKSGNNFLLFLVAMLLYRKKMDWATKGKMIQNVSSEPIENLPPPHLVWSHDSYDPSYPKVIYLVRDPRDVVISYFHHFQKYYGESRDFDEFFEVFMEGGIGPGMWDANIESWLDNQEKVKNGFLLVKYEDLLENPSKEAKRIIRFLNLDRSEQEINEAVSWASFDNMKALEQKQHSHLNHNSPFVNQNIPFVREGKANKWKSVLSKAQQQQINQTFDKTLSRLGYK